MDGHITALGPDDGLAKSRLQAPECPRQIRISAGAFSNQPAKSAYPVSFKERLDCGFMPARAAEGLVKSRDVAPGISVVCAEAKTEAVNVEESFRQGLGGLPRTHEGDDSRSNKPW
jgi:hypothetical protein